MAKLTTAERSKLKDSDFALSGRRYPIQDREHGEKALQLGKRALNAGTITASEYRKICSAVKLRYPEIKEADD